MLTFPDGVARRLHEPWRDKLAQAEARYTVTRATEDRAVYLRTLRAFADLVIRNKIPDESET